MAALKTLEHGGRIALGEKYTGQQVLVDELEPGVWMIKTGEFVPHNESWLHQPKASASLDRGLRWLADNPAAETDLEELRGHIEK